MKLRLTPAQNPSTIITMTDSILHLGVRHFAAVTLLLVSSVCAGSSQQPQPKPAVPLEPIDAILDAFRTHPVVVLDEGPHTNEPGAEFRLRLLRDPRFPSVVNDIVVECGNALYQNVMDRFVGGEEVPYDMLKQIWQNTTQPYEVWEHVIYEEFFRAVRSLNATLPRERKLRLLLGDPPINWDTIHSGKDWIDFMRSPLGNRDGFPSGLIQREVLAKGRHALVVYGVMHLLRGAASFHSAQGVTSRRMDSVVDLLERDGASVFTIFVNSSSDLELLQSDVRSWKEPSLFLLKGTIPGAADFTFYCPIGKPNVRVGPMDEKFDAVLYLGHPLTFTYSPISPGLVTDDKYIAMRATRVGYRRALFEEQAVKAPADIANWAAEFRSRPKQLRPILPRLWRTYIASGMPAALARVPRDSKEIPQGVEALNKLSEALLKRGKIDDAIAAANNNAERFPESPWPYLTLGAAYSAKGDKAQSAMHYLHALKLDPGNKDATDALARQSH
jgi:hypothetical protein